MKVKAIIQARMGSTRLPGKVLADIGGASMLARVVRRTQRSRPIDEVIVVTTLKPGDEVIVAECEELGVACFRGQEEDVLDRYYRAAQAFQADAIVRITSDCPLIEPEVIDQVVRAFLDERPDYASNALGLRRTFPRGLDTEVMTLEALARAWREATEPYQRVHVTPYIYQRPECFRLLAVTGEIDYGSHRWTVDTPEDLAFVRAIYKRLDDDDTFSWRSVLALLEREPELVELNRSVEQKSLHEG